MEEVSPGNAYILPEPQTVTIPSNDIAYATMENVWKHWRAAITKVDADTGKASPQGDATLNGAEYTLYKSGKAVATYTVSNGGFTTDLFPCSRIVNSSCCIDSESPDSVMEMVMALPDSEL